MNDLLELQRAFQRALLENAQLVASAVVDSDTLRVKERIDVYRDAYRLRLRDGLGANYPRLQQLLGEDAFVSIADAYIDAHPSRHSSIRWFGDRLANEMRHAFPAQPWLAELAEWEWRIAAAFDAADAPSVAISRLSAIQSDAWPHLRFDFHPSVQCIRMHTNAPALFKALTEGLPVPQPATTESTTWLIWRSDVTTRFRSLEPSEASALMTLMRGESFEIMCTALCAGYAPAELALRAATWLREWIEAGMVCAVNSPPAID